MTWEPDQILLRGFPVGSDGIGSACNAGEAVFDTWIGKIPQRREWLPIPVYLPGEFHGQRAGPDPINKKVGHSPKEKSVPSVKSLKRENREGFSLEEEMDYELMSLNWELLIKGIFLREGGRLSFETQLLDKCQVKKTCVRAFPTGLERMISVSRSKLFSLHCSSLLW